MHGPVRSVGLAVAAALLALPPAAPGQVVHYSYDAAGRLSVVGDPRGDLAVYDYDAVGNLLSIRRIAVADVAAAVAIGHVAPEAAARGASVSIFGKGFAPTAAANAVSFNGAVATVLTASPTRLIARVPANATSGPIHVTTPLGTAASGAFHVLGTLAVSPPTAVLAPRASVRFVAVSDVATGVRWSVDRVPGGDPQRGTISNDGLYVAPDRLPLTGVRVVATSLLDAAVEATAQVTMVTTRPLFVVSAPITVGLLGLSRLTTARTALSIGVATNTAFAIAAPTAIGVAPIISSLTPSTAAPGETVRLVFTGSGFEGASRLEFVAANGPDHTLIVGDLTINADGREAEADVTVSQATASGPRVVRIVTPAGSSGEAVPGANIFTVR